MFVYLGGETVVDAREVVVILDARRLQRAADARALLARAGTELSGEDRGTARALVVTTRGLMLTSVTPVTVARRIERMTKTRRGTKAEK